MHRRNSHKHWPRFDDAECVCVINCVNLLFESTYQHLGKWVLLFGRGNFHLNDSLSVELRLVKSLDRFLCALGRLKRDRRIASGLLGLSIQKEKDALRAWLLRLDSMSSPRGAYIPLATLILPIVENEPIRSFLLIVFGSPVMKTQSVQSDGKKEFSLAAAAAS